MGEAWASPWWFALCLVFTLGWVAGLVEGGRWTDDVYHLWLNSPTTGLTFLGVFLLHNSTKRFEDATNARLQELIERLEGALDPVDDEGQKPHPG